MEALLVYRAGLRDAVRILNMLISLVPSFRKTSNPIKYKFFGALKFHWPLLSSVF